MNLYIDWNYKNIKKENYENFIFFRFKMKKDFTSKFLKKNFFMHI